MKSFLAALFFAFPCYAGLINPYVSFPSGGASCETEMNAAGTPTLWLDASDESSIASTGGVVDTWNDKSGNNRDLTGSGTARPATGTAEINTLNVVDFDGVNDVLTSTATLDNIINNNTGTVIIVHQQDAFVAAPGNVWETAFLLTENSGFWGLGVDNTSSGAWRAFNYDTTADVLNKTIVINTPYISVLRHSGGTLYASTDGAAETSTASGNTGAMTGTLVMGASPASVRFINGKIAEVIAYDTSVTYGSLVTCLSNKWGL